MPVGPGAALTDNLLLVRELGRGAMGAVWIAEHRTLRTHVAVKVLPPAMASDAAALARFQQEAQAAARIKSPHVVQVHDFGVTTGGEPFLVMELLEGEDLGKRLKRVGVLDLAQARTILTQVLRGLEQAHAQGVVHRDIKPENLFLIDAGGQPFVKILDFGIAKQQGPDGHGLTQSGAMLGTPYYMSPEQLVRPRDVDHRTDLWAVAVVAYRCLVGRVPFDGETIAALSLTIHTGKYPPPSSWMAEAPPGLDAWFERALRHDPSGRFSSAREMAEAFERVGAGAIGAAPAAPVAASTTYGGAATPAASAAMPGASATYGGAAMPGASAMYGAAAMPGASAVMPGASATPPAMQGGTWAMPPGAPPPPAPGMAAPGAWQAAAVAPAPPKRTGLLLGLGAAVVLVAGAAGAFLLLRRDPATDSVTTPAGPGAVSSVGAVVVPSQSASGRPSAVAAGPGGKPAVAAAPSTPGAPAAPSFGAVAPGGAAAGNTASLVAPAVTSAQPVAPAAPAGKTAGSLRAIALSCWKNNEGANKGQAADSASVTLNFGGSRSVLISGASGAKGFRACTVTNASSMPVDPAEGPSVSVSVSLPAGPP